MFGALRRTFGLIKVSETATDIVVSGVPADTMSRDISKIWNTSRIETNLFTSIGKNGFSFPKFFAIEVHYMLGQIDQYRYSRMGVRTIRSIQHEMEQNTWLKTIEEEHPPRVDFSRLSELNIQLKEHQDNFLKVYDQEVTKYGLRGYLLSADPGTGKTYMGLALSHCLHADITIIVSPKNALDRVWGDSILAIFKKPKKFWMANSGTPYHGEEIIVTNYESIAKAAAAASRHVHSNACVILDESHNLNEAKSNRTQGFLNLCGAVDAKNVLWSSGSPLKAMGYEMVPLLRSIDPLFTKDVEMRFVRIFGKETGRALDILRHRIGKVSFHVASSAAFDNKATTDYIKIKLSNGNDYTIETMRTKLKAYMDERMKYYQSNFKQYQKVWDEAIATYDKQVGWMDRDKRNELSRYKSAVKTISSGFDPVAHKELAAFANHFEKKVLIPALPTKEQRDAFRETRSVIKYYPLRAMGEALGAVLGRARVQCHLDMIKQIDWKEIVENSAKKVLIFSSYVDVVKAIDAQLKGLGYDGIMVIGETNKNIAPMMQKLGDDPKLRYAVATYASLSTAVPVTACSTEVLTNAPWRSFELKQAKARIDRMGQDAPVKFIFTTLDTGKDPNISTRTHDIMEWSAKMVAAMMGGEGVMDISTQLNKDYTAAAKESFVDPEDDFTMGDPVLEQLTNDFLRNVMENYIDASPTAFDLVWNEMQECVEHH
jgi:hypothetical protein